MPGPVIITSCTHGKREEPEAILCARELHPGTQQEVAHEWLTRLRTETLGVHHVPAEDLYCGRAFSEASLAAGTNPMYIVSAGLGLVPRDREIPAYSLTISGRGDDSIRTKVSKLNKVRWWSLVSKSLFSSDLLKELSKRPRRVIVVALPLTYFDMVEQALVSLHPSIIERLRIVGLRPENVCASLQDQVMPFDDRLNGPDSPLVGTRGDFAQRCAHFFVEQILSDSRRSAREDATKIKRKISKWDLPVPIPRRAKKSDDQIRALIKKHWDQVGGSSARMLRYLRDDINVACEQSRLGKLYREVAEKRESGLWA